MAGEAVSGRRAVQLPRSPASSLLVGHQGHPAAGRAPPRPPIPRPPRPPGAAPARAAARGLDEGEGRPGPAAAGEGPAPRRPARPLLTRRRAWGPPRQRPARAPAPRPPAPRPGGGGCLPSAPAAQPRRESGAERGGAGRPGKAERKAWLSAGRWPAAQAWCRPPRARSVVRGTGRLPAGRGLCLRPALGGPRGTPEGRSVPLLPAGGWGRGRGRLLAFPEPTCHAKSYAVQNALWDIAVPAASLCFRLMAVVAGRLGRQGKGKAFVQPTGLVLHCCRSEHCLCKCSSPAWTRSLNNWVTIAETQHVLSTSVRALTKAVKPKLLSAGGVAVPLLRHCLCMGFSLPLAPFNLSFGKTTQYSSPLCVSVSSYLNLLQRLLKATGGPGKHPGSACTLAAWRRCCRCSTKRRETSSHAPQPRRRARPCVRRATRGGAGQGSSMPPLHPSPVAAWLGSSRSRHRRGKAGPQSWGVYPAPENIPTPSHREQQVWLVDESQCGYI